MDEQYFFRNRKEVDEFFKNQVFEFHFSGGGLMTFRTLQPTLLGKDLYSFELTFYANINPFFKYSSLNGENNWLNMFQLSKVDKKRDLDNETETLYFAKFIENWKRK